MASKTIIATRMELLSTKKKITLATKGHKLLKEKRDALISEFFKIIDGLKQLRKEAEDKLGEAYKALVIAEAVSGSSEVKLAAGSISNPVKLEEEHNTIMGIRVPVFKVDASDKDEHISANVSIKLDEAGAKFKEALPVVIQLAEKETTVKKLAEEIKKTKRKVNALERILLPKLESQKVFITMKLEEMEREAFGRLKIIKSKIDGN